MSYELILFIVCMNVLFVCIASMCALCCRTWSIQIPARTYPGSIIVYFDVET